MKRLAILAGLALLSGCDKGVTMHQAPSPVTQPEPLATGYFESGVHIIHDDKRSVTCWVFTMPSSRLGGISCIPDSALSDGLDGTIRQMALQGALAVMRAHEQANIEIHVSDDGLVTRKGAAL